MSDPLLTGTFGVLVALITWLLAGFRQRDTYRREMQIEYLRKLEILYASEIENLEMSIRITVSLGSYAEIESANIKNYALIRLLSTKQINEQVEKVSDIMHRWSSLYRQGAPKPVGDTGASIVKSGDSKFTRQAEELKPQLDDEILSLIEMMANHLAKERKSA